MQIKKICIHNFRSIIDCEIEMSNYTLLVGENNAGKSTIICALRMFYEDAGIKFNESSDFPKIRTNDSESWVEISFCTTDEEQETLKEEYKSEDKLLKVRKYFKSNDGRVKPNQSNIYAYENNGKELSKNLFYGAKGVSQNKLGQIIYIPEISKSDDTLKLSGPSPFRDIVNHVLGRVLSESAAFEQLKKSFQEFNNSFQEESTPDGLSFSAVVKDINENLANWGVEFGAEVNSVGPPDIIKGLLTHYMVDKHLGLEHKLEVTAFGQGLQRHLIYSLIKLAVKYGERKKEVVSEKKEFSPDFVFLLFEEPEVFLHPSQQEQLNINLQKLAKEAGKQVFITTHSPVFTCRNIGDLCSIIRVVKKSGHTEIYQVLKDQLDSLMDENTGLHKSLEELAQKPDISVKCKKEIENKTRPAGDGSIKIEEEVIKYFLWLDSERSALFFAKHVVICEGATEKILFDCCIHDEWQEIKDRHIYFLDAMGKYSIHRYMNLFRYLGIEHSVLMDQDAYAGVHKHVNDFIEKNKNKFTRGIYAFNTDIEDFVGIPKLSGNKKYLKPANMLIHYKQKRIPEDKILGLRNILLDSLLSDQPVAEPVAVNNSD